MFYYPQVLQRHTGCFSTIWLVATKGTRVTRRDFLKVNVISTCDDIMSYVLAQVPAPLPGLPRPRFSLYLSSQLQYGVILVYHRQCAILLQELQSIVGQLMKHKKSLKIDLAEHGRQAVDLPDALALLEEAEGAPDPLFGLMQDVMPSPNTLLQYRENLRESSPEFPERELPLPPDAAAAAAREIGITASPDTITLREMEPVAIPIAEFEGEELYDQHPDTIDFLMAQADDFLEEHLEMPREEVAPEEQQREIGSTIDIQPTALSGEDAMLLPQEEPGVSVERPEPPSDRLTPVSVPAIPSPPSAAKEPRRPALQAEDEPPLEVEPRRRRRSRRRRQLTFFDPETQINEEEQREQVDDPLIETKRPLFPPSPSERMLSVAELFNNPCTFLPEEVEFLWRQAAIICPLSDLDLQVGERGSKSTESTESTESSEKEREPEMMEAAEVAEVAVTVKQELPEEVTRTVDVAEPEMIDISDQGSLTLEHSDRAELSREIISPIPTSDKEGPAVSRPGAALQDIPEAVDELLERDAAESPGTLPDLPERDEPPVLFQSLLPPEADRRTVSNIFQRLLGSLSVRKMRAEQDEPYGDILIFPGPVYGEVVLNL